MASRQAPPLDEIQWRGPAPQGIHSNSVLWYFSDSPFFDQTSNNAVVINQGLSNQSMQRLLETREAFEGRLKSMSGLEFVVAQEPADMAPGTGTGVWVIRKQTRRKRAGSEDEITVHATYFVVGENIYMAPTLADVMSSRIATISSAISNIFPAADNVQNWSPASGRVYKNPTPTATSRPKGLESKEATPMPDGLGKGSSTNQKAGSKTAPDSRLAEESLAIHLRYGGEYMDENPITGQPGSFHLSSTGRKDKLAAPPPQPLGGGSIKRDGTAPPLPALNTKVAAENPLARNGKETKSPRTGAAPKPRRRKSKGGTTTPS
ncbi:MED6 mediator sub complex component-domain-containing protein [Phialemonium atrogriseum]|uniref:Mediator of RNA polymerase II transcription subunit 6 n=1 Tax=Phialemonium atrogriseum TaxID=1093897 RepID=A0AAJ0BYE4_9PEZI|nr:MED6 mediator sub complex component-domain-containing protein [Phialemonium atrogriseum]KAK1766157.1 MED6 mediator sub complex component-domain-containing protein [Phialemonium atrogriseum]